MKKKALSLVLAVLLVLSFLSMNVSAMAETPERWDYSNISYDVSESGAQKAQLLRLQEDEPPILIEKVTTYHWNYGLGTEKAGEISIIEYKKTDGVWKKDHVCGSWKATGRNEYGIENVYWDAYPDFTMQPGHVYIVQPSDSSTWTYNADSNDRGMFEIHGVYVNGTDTDTKRTGGQVLDVVKMHGVDLSAWASPTPTATLSVTGEKITVDIPSFRHSGFSFTGLHLTGTVYGKPETKNDYTQTLFRLDGGFRYRFALENDDLVLRSYTVTNEASHPYWWDCMAQLYVYPDGHTDLTLDLYGDLDYRAAQGGNAEKQDVRIDTIYLGLNGECRMLN